MNYGSLFAGIGGFDLGFDRAEMCCAWQVENDTHCNSILQRHWPDMQRFGDVHDVGRHNLKAVDLIAGGFPCQDLSVAGRRAGLAGERSGLWWQFVRVLEELHPRWVVVENVPGLLSSGDKRDMGILLGALAKLGYLGTWRVLDAQFYGVAQRRRRVFIVGHLGDGRAAEVLFERTSGAWDSPPCREAGAGVTAPIKAGTPSRRGGGSWPIAEEFVLTYTVQTNDGGNHKRKDRPNGGMYVKRTEQALTLGSSDQTYIATFPGMAQSGAGWAPPSMPVDEDRCGPLDTERAQCVAQTQWGEIAGTLSKRHDSSPCSDRGQNIVAFRGVRRLTPCECERLQGFPDDWTRWGVDESGKRVELSDSARYRMLGNAVAVPVAEWIGQRIAAMEGS